MAMLNNQRVIIELPGFRMNPHGTNGVMGLDYTTWVIGKLLGIMYY